MRNLFLLVLLLAIKTQAQNSTPGYGNIAIDSSRAWLDLDFVGDGITGHQMDILLPKTGRAPYPVIICVYGSAWFSNNLKATTFTTGLGQRLLREGFAVATVNYRSSSDAKFPAQIQDVKAAVRFIKGNHSSFSLDAGFIGITGWSSGGHLAALAGATNDVKKKSINGREIDIEGALGKFTGESSRVDAVVDWFGPTDFLIMDSCGSSFRHDDGKSPESSLIGGPIQEHKDEVALANPISYVNKDDPPFLIFHGDKDPLVPHCESEKLYERLQEKKVRSELVIVPGGGHGPGVMIDKYYDRMISFLRDRVKALQSNR